MSEQRLDILIGDAVAVILDENTCGTYNVVCVRILPESPILELTLESHLDGSLLRTTSDNVVLVEREGRLIYQKPLLATEEGVKAK